MRTKRQLAAAALLLAGCTWRAANADDCARLAASPAIDEAVRLAAQSGVSEIEVSHTFCANEGRLLIGLPDLRHEEVGWCARSKELVPARDAAIRLATGQQCEAAVRRGAAYAAWSTTVGRQSLYVTPRRYISHQLPPGV
jgi:hypothetical protein